MKINPIDEEKEDDIFTLSELTIIKKIYTMEAVAMSYPAPKISDYNENKVALAKYIIQRIEEYNYVRVGNISSYWKCTIWCNGKKDKHFTYMTKPL